MKKIFIILALCIYGGNTFAVNDFLVIDDLYILENRDIPNRIIVDENSVLVADSVNINSAIALENLGSIYADLYICDGCDFTIRNSGLFDGVIYGGVGSDITQIIETNSDINKLFVSGAGFSILVQNTEPLKLSDIMSISQGVDKIILDNALLIMDTGAGSFPIMRTVQPSIELVGNIIVEIKDMIDGRLIMSNVSGDGTLKVDGTNLDPLYVVETVRHGTNIYLDIYRETDYEKLLKNNIGKFANQLRLLSPDNLTIRAMDNAENMNQINSVINDSVIFNPINLIKPIKLFNRMRINNFNPFTKTDTFGIDALYIKSSEVDLYSGIGTITGQIKDVNISASVVGGGFTSNDEINEFSGNFYGGNIRAVYDDKTVWMDAGVGFVISGFNVDVIFDGDGASSNPDGLAGYGMIDVGLKYDYGNYYISPFIGTMGEYAKVLHQSEFNLGIHTGAYSGYKILENGIETDYNLFVKIRSNNIQTIGARIKFWSVADSAGGGFSYGLLHDEMGLSHKLSLNFNFMF
jgi:hypothetical protein